MSSVTDGVGLKSSVRSRSNCDAREHMPARMRTDAGLANENALRRLRTQHTIALTARPPREVEVASASVEAFANTGEGEP